MPVLPNNKQFYVQAHRGYSEIYPENTLLAMRKAFEAGADQVEIDVALTKDNHLVVIHDYDVQRTTNGTGLVSAFTLEDLKKLDAGSWKEPSFHTERIPTLAEAAEITQGHGWLNIEIKSRGRPGLPVTTIAKKLSQTLREYNMHQQAIVASFDLAPLLEVQRHDPELNLMLIDWDAPEDGGLEKAITHKFYGWTPKPNLASTERIQKAVAAGLVVQVDIKDLTLIETLYAAGVRGFSSDDPAQLKTYVDGLNFTTT